MDRQPWLMAVSMLARHGGEAVEATFLQLATLHRLVQLNPNPEDRAMLRFWQQTGKALIAIVEAKRAGSHGSN